ncbi:hypothetical protein [Chryseobacterium oranimense]|uniref:hypothetical protein n=1 Tax=Chryseobacterium oranimense TaxID=421058 RepID=UPI0031D8DDAB
MESKQLNKILLLITFVISMSAFSQMKMADIEGEKFSVNSKTERRNLIKISDNKNYSVYYILDRRDFDIKKGSGTNGTANIVFFSKKYDKGILVTFEQMIYHSKTNVYDISLRTGSHDKYMFIPSMIIVDKDFNYEYLMRYSYIHLPHDINVYKSSILIQDNKNRCNTMHTGIEGNLIYENIDDVLSNIAKINSNEIRKDCNPIIYDMDLKDFFPKKIIK